MIIRMFCIFFAIQSVSASLISEYRVHFNENSKLTGSFSKQSGGSVVALAHFKRDNNASGWSYLEIETSGDYSDEWQAYAAGVAEARATRTLIEDHWFNTVRGYCNGADKYCYRLQQYLTQNLEWLKKQIGYRNGDPYWTQVKLALLQLVGLQDAYANKENLEPNMEINVTQLLMIQVNGELEALEKALNKPAHLRRALFGSGHCSAFLKNDLVAHVTWSGYNTMLRVQKLYRFNFNKTAYATLMSSYPGTLMSVDDFYLTSHKLVVTETTIGNSNDKLWSEIKPTYSVPAWIRTIVSNRLATTPENWAITFKRFNSGTYNNQWMIRSYSSNKFFVLEQIPGTVIYKDMTDMINNGSYWPSYNIPYFKDIYDKSGVGASASKYGDFFVYDQCPRALIFKRDQHKVKDLDTLSTLMRYNDFKNDWLAKCDCTPPYSGENGVSARCDLNPRNGTYPFETLGFRCHGATDVKIVDRALFEKMRFYSISGPTHQSLLVFDWSTNPCASMTPHRGQPARFDFKPVVHDWQSKGWDGTMFD